MKTVKLTTIDMFRCSGGPEVTHQISMFDVPCSFPGSDKDFYVCFFVLLLCVFFNLFGPKNVISHAICNSL